MYIYIYIYIITAFCKVALSPHMNDDMLFSHKCWESHITWAHPVGALCKWKSMQQLSTVTDGPASKGSHGSITDLTYEGMCVPSAMIHGASWRCVPLSAHREKCSITFLHTHTALYKSVCVCELYIHICLWDCIEVCIHTEVYIHMCRKVCVCVRSCSHGTISLIMWRPSLPCSERPAMDACNVPLH